MDKQIHNFQTILTTWPNVPRAFSMRRITAWKTHGFQLIIIRKKPCVFHAIQTHGKRMQHNWPCILTCSLVGLLITYKCFSYTFMKQSQIANRISIKHSPDVVQMLVKRSPNVHHQASVKHSQIKISSCWSGSPKVIVRLEFTATLNRTIKWQEKDRQYFLCSNGFSLNRMACC